MTGEERRKILEMCANGTITADEADKLLGTVEEGDNSPAIFRSSRSKRFLRIEIQEADSNERVEVNVPLALCKMAMSFMPQRTKEELDSQGIDLDEIFQMIYEGAEGELVNIDTEDGESVRIYLD
ncbi:MAG: hypothetical protein M0Q40_12585 [Limnochordia bacterium]|jgi:hypothetical protein|nr:hypothetical protein [Limnochordia bacterium]